jgi:hypothetical protein
MNRANPTHKKVSELIKKTSITIINIAIETIYQGSKVDTKRAKFAILSTNTMGQNNQYMSTNIFSQL